MADLGLLSGLAEGIKQGFLTYNQVRKSNLEEDQYKRQQKRDDALYRLGLLKEGYKESGDGFELTPEETQKREFEKSEKKHKGFLEELNTEAKLQDAGLDVIKDETGKIIGTKPAKGMSPKKELQQLDLQLKRKELSGKTLPATEAQQMGSADSAVASLKDIRNMVDKNKDIFSPGGVLGYGGALLKGAQAKFQSGEEGQRLSKMKAVMAQHAKTIGRYLEGGKLTDADYEVYKNEFFPNEKDTLESGMNKIDNLERMVAQKRELERQALGQAGYATGNITPANIPGAVSIQKKGLIGGGSQELKIGTIENGYRYKGGKKSDPNSWEKVK